MDTQTTSGGADAPMGRLGRDISNRRKTHVSQRYSWLKLHSRFSLEGNHSLVFVVERLGVSDAELDLSRE
jgi:hypothetical protein